MRFRLSYKAEGRQRLERVVHAQNMEQAVLAWFGEHFIKDQLSGHIELDIRIQPDVGGR
jgi:hypothetical protein